MNTVLSGTTMLNEQVAEELINTALAAPPKIDASIKRWHRDYEGVLYCKITPWQYDALIELITGALDESRRVAIKALTGLWGDYYHMPYDTFTNEHDAMPIEVLESKCSVYQFGKKEAADWFDLIQAGYVHRRGREDADSK